MWKCAVFSVYRHDLAFCNLLLLFYKSVFFLMTPSASCNPLQLIVKAHTGSVCWSWVSQTCGCCRTARLSATTRLQTDLTALGRPVHYNPLFLIYRLPPLPRGCYLSHKGYLGPFKALPFLWPQMLLPLLMNDSDFQPLCAFFLLTNEPLWPEETPFAFVLFT